MPLNIAVIGAGAFGRNHIRLYRELPGTHLAAIVEPNPARIAELTAAGLPIAPAANPHHSAVSATHASANTNPLARGGNAESRNSAPDTRIPQSLTSELPPDAAAEHPIPVYPTTESLLAAIAAGELTIDAASVCTPTSTHHAVTAQLLQAGIHVLVEKPIAATLAEADSLIALAAKRNRTLTVGHLERFNPAVQAVLPLLRGPMFFESHRLSVFSPRSLDTDVVLDLMIHDLDIVLTLTGGTPVTGVHAVGLPILSGRTDIANVRVEFSTGCVANFTASRVSTERVRKLRFFQPHQYLSLDYARQDLLVIEVQPPSTSPTHDTGAPRLASGVPGERSQLAGVAQTRVPSSATQTALPTLSMSKPEVPSAEPLRLELESFLHAIQTGGPPTVTAPQARDALALALQIQQVIQDHARHAGLQAFVSS